jgi:hypothetical protein
MKVEINAEKKKVVGIFTTFQESDTAYSLNNVTEDQIKMLVMHGYKPVVITAGDFKSRGAYDLAEIVRIAAVPCHNEVRKDESFDSDVTKIKEDVKKVIEDYKIDVFLTHDIVYQPAALKHNIACRMLAEEFPNIKWLHWIHSATSPFQLITLRQFFTDEYMNVLSKPFPNSKYVFFNHYSIPRIARNFNVRKEDVAVVYHPIDMAEYFGWDEMTTKLVYEKDLLSADAICVYPIRLDRGKQVEDVIKTMAELRFFKIDLRTSFDVRIVICDFHSSSNDPNDDKFRYRQELKQLAKDLNLSDKELIFTSEFDPSLKVRCSRQMVRNLFLLSNVYIHPSVSESYSLTTQEATVCGNTVVLNADFPPMVDIYGDEPIYRQYSSNIDAKTGLHGSTNTKYGSGSETDEMLYHQETAQMIADRLHQPDKMFQRKLIKTRNLHAIFVNQLQPLVEG